MSTRSDNPFAASASAGKAVRCGAAGEVPRGEVRTADMVKAGIAATTRESSAILAERATARRGNDLSMEELG